MSSFSTNGRDLLLELHRSDWIPPFNEDGIRQAIRHINELDVQIRDKFAIYGDELETHQSLHCSVVANHQALLRMKRCALTYLHVRMKKIKQLRWETGSRIPPEIQNSMSNFENEFFKGYDVNVLEYMNSLKVDLNTDLEPPKELYIEIRVLEDCGEIYTSNGILLTLKKNTNHFVRRCDVEGLIRLGMVEHIVGA